MKNDIYETSMLSTILKKAASAVICASFAISAGAQMQMQTDTETGAIISIIIRGDSTNMDWLMKTDGSQYAWITKEYGWGLGYTTVVKGHESRKVSWNKPEKYENDGKDVTYNLGDVTLNVKRSVDGGDILERYVFTNTGKSEVSLYETGIYMPFNDNYPDAKTCVNLRSDVHIWDGGSAAYINALRMGGFGPHLGLAVTEGAINHYEIWERGMKKHNSQVRGLFAMNIPDVTLRPGQSYTVAWRVFSHTGNADFKRRMLAYGGVLAESEKYVYDKGDTARVVMTSGKELKNVTADLNGVPVKVSREGDKYVVTVHMEQEGDARTDFHYDGNRNTHVLCLVIDSAEKLIDARAEFIQTYQQMNKKDDPRYGAYMVFDNEGDSIYLNDTPNCNPVDRDEGAERLGMGLFLARQYMRTKDEKIRESFLRYVKFVREKLQTPDYVTYSSVDHKGRNRKYNYTWAATLFFYAYNVTGEKQYAIDGYRTLQSLYKQSGYGFYSIEIPAMLGLDALKDAGLKKEYRDLLKDFKKSGDIMVANGTDYPKHEVNFEQSIVAPAVYFLEQLYIITGEAKYLDEAKRQMPVMEAFNGFQPSYHLNDIAIRHWDDYWFGKSEMFGDTFPHYWSTITAAAFHLYAKITGDGSYRKRAENIVRNNLCLFTKDGHASCAYLYPYKVDGVKGKFYDGYANDQDWALYYYLMVNED